MDLVIGHLYGDLMNTYGDNGNILVLQKRCEWRGISVKIINISIGYEIKSKEIDLFFFGGGQDQAQSEVAKDLVSTLKGEGLKKELNRGVPLLSICGGYQLLGEYYQPHQGEKLTGLDFLPVYTVASPDRMIGNIVVSCQSSEKTIQSDDLLIGFENHSGKTYLKKGGIPFGNVIKGFGNNGQDQTEGCIYKNSIGCYMHGSLLPKNPQLTDWLIEKALEVKYGKQIKLEPLEDSFEAKARAVFL